jgi:hypothetical protein
MPGPPHPGQVISGRLFSEPMRIETAIQTGDGTWRLGLVGTRTEKFRSVTLTSIDLAGLTILQTGRSFTRLHTCQDPARCGWREVTQVEHYRLGTHEIRRESGPNHGPTAGY